VSNRVGATLLGKRVADLSRCQTSVWLLCLVPALPGASCVWLPEFTVNNSLVLNRHCAMQSCPTNPYPANCTGWLVPALQTLAAEVQERRPPRFTSDSELAWHVMSRESEADILCPALVASDAVHIEMAISLLQNPRFYSSRQLLGRPSLVRIGSVEAAITPLGEVACNTSVRAIRVASDNFPPRCRKMATADWLTKDRIEYQYCSGENSSASRIESFAGPSR